MIHKKFEFPIRLVRNAGGGRQRRVGLLALSLVAVVSVAAGLLPSAPISVAAAATASQPTFNCNKEASETPLPTATGQFFISGSTIVDPDGYVFQPCGADVGTTNNFGWFGDAVGHSSQAAQWGWNTVRLTMYCSNFTHNTRYRDGYGTLMSYIDTIVKQYTAKKIVVMVECQDPYSSMLAGNKGSRIGLPAGSPDINANNKDDVGKTYAQQMDQYATDVTTKYKTNPYVWFNWLNEPSLTDSEFISVNQHFNAIRNSVGSTNIVVADALNAGNDAGIPDKDNAAYQNTLLYHNAMGPALSAGQCNQLYSIHAYGWGLDETPTDAEAAAFYSNKFAEIQAKHLPLIIGEFGYTTDGTSTAGTPAGNKAAADALFAVAPKFGIGVLPWHATFGGDAYTLKADGHSPYYEVPKDGTMTSDLSALGKQLWTADHPATTTPVAFTGDAAASNCGFVGAPSAVKTALAATAKANAAQLGAVTSTAPQAVGTLWVRSYAKGSVVWSKASGAQAVYGVIATKWQTYGGAASSYPTVAEGATYRTGGLHDQFSDGSEIVYTPTTGTHVIKNGVITGWNNSGGSKGFLGYPTSDQACTAGVCSAGFEGGAVKWDSHTGTITVTKK